MRLEFSSVATLKGTLRPPSDKSLSHRALMLAACAGSDSEILDPLLGEDCRSTLACLEALGARSDQAGSTIRMTPAGEWWTPSSPLDCGNSGTTMRLLSGLIASRPIEATLSGDASLSRRPMRRIAAPLRLMGATVEGETPPLRIRGARLHGIDYVSPVASAQVKSCVLLAGLRAEGETWVTEPSQSRDHTERMLTGLGVPVKRRSETSVGVEGGSVWGGFRFRVPADLSSAAFWLVAAAIVPGSEVVLTDVGVNPTRTGVLEVLRAAGARLEQSPPTSEMGEPVADLAVWGGAPLRGFSIGGPLVPRLIDEIPVLAVLATQCVGETAIRDASELRVKESDRIARVVEGLQAMGARIEARPDGIVVEGPTPLKGARIDATGDHRIAMAFAVAALVAQGTTVIDGAESIATSYPGFLEHLEGLTVV